MKITQKQYTLAMGNFSAKVGTEKKWRREQVIGNCGFDRSNNLVEMLVEFVKRTRVPIMNTFFMKHKNRKWTWKSSNEETKNEIHFVMCEQRDIMQYIEVVAKIQCSDHRLV